MENQDFIKKDIIKENEEENVKSGKHKMGIKHAVMMALCCILPLLIIMILPLIGFKNISWSWIIFILCPLMHIGMMFKKK